MQQQLKCMKNRRSQDVQLFHSAFRSVIGTLKFRNIEKKCFYLIQLLLNERIDEWANILRWRRQNTNIILVTASQSYSLTFAIYSVSVYDAWKRCSYGKFDFWIRFNEVRHIYVLLLNCCTRSAGASSITALHSVTLSIFNENCPAFLANIFQPVGAIWPRPVNINSDTALSQLHAKFAKCAFSY